jgi:hypothetical protein
MVALKMEKLSKNRFTMWEASITICEYASSEGELLFQARAAA